MELATLESRMAHINVPTATEATLRFLDTAGTFTGRGTFYNALGALKDENAAIHAGLFGVDRGLYAIMSAHPGTTHLSRQVSVGTLLSNPRTDETEDGWDTLGITTMLTPAEEYMVLGQIIGSVPYHRVLKCFLAMKDNRVNNSRTRRIMLDFILNDRNLAWHAVKYREKLRSILVHVYNERMAGILQAILTKSPLTWDNKEGSIVRVAIKRFNGDGDQLYHMLECLSFILGNENVSEPILSSYVLARGELEAGSKLPPEVLEGIRATYHPNINPKKVLELTKRQMTDRQKMVLQASAEKRRVDIGDFDPTKQDPTSLYLYAFERGMTGEILEALDSKAWAAARALPIHLGRPGIVVDNSMSMAGHKTQPLRPMARALAMRDMFERAGDGGALIEYTNPTTDFLARPGGPSDIATPLVKVIANGAESVIIISDGYENAPAGRTAEVVESLRRMGNTVPVYQVSPVMSAEASGIRELSEEIPILPAGDDPKSIGLGMARMLLETDFTRGVHAMIGISTPRLLEG